MCNSIKCLTNTLNDEIATLFKHIISKWVSTIISINHNNYFSKLQLPDQTNLGIILIANFYVSIEARQVYNLFQDLWNESLGFSQKSFK